MWLYVQGCTGGVLSLVLRYIDKILKTLNRSKNDWT
jgi:hypothetical protein